jgi:hypothetical protein
MSIVTSLMMIMQSIARLDRLKQTLMKAERLCTAAVDPQYVELIDKGCPLARQPLCLQLMH